MKVTGEMETKDHEQERQINASCCATHEHHGPEHKHGLELREVLRVVFVALAAAAVWFHLWEPFPGASVIGLVGALVGGYPLYNLSHHRGRSLWHCGGYSVGYPRCHRTRRTAWFDH